MSSAAVFPVKDQGGGSRAAPNLCPPLPALPHSKEPEFSLSSPPPTPPADQLLGAQIEDGEDVSLQHLQRRWPGTGLSPLQARQKAPLKWH